MPWVVNGCPENSQPATCHPSRPANSSTWPHKQCRYVQNGGVLGALLFCTAECSSVETAATTLHEGLAMANLLPLSSLWIKCHVNLSFWLDRKALGALGYQMIYKEEELALGSCSGFCSHVVPSWSPQNLEELAMQDELWPQNLSNSTQQSKGMAWRIQGRGERKAH